MGAEMIRVLSLCGFLCRAKAVFTLEGFLSYGGKLIKRDNAADGWVPDQAKCLDCDGTFGWTIFCGKRRHHCCFCGLCLCGSCTPKRVEVFQGSASNKYRCCSKCFPKLE